MDLPAKPLLVTDPSHCGRFRLIARLGIGGMGVAYLAEDGMSRQVVVKMVQSDLAQDPSMRRRFRHEVMAALAAESPFVPEILASDISAERQWIATELVQGPTLDHLVHTHGPLNHQQQHALAGALAEGLAGLHTNGLVHRDVKPANIICTDRGPRLIDFGIATRANVKGVTETGALAPGSPGWMAPEQLDPFAEPTAAIDLFSWGCVCWFAASATSPLAARTPQESAAKLRSWRSAPPTPAMLEPRLAPLVTRALSRQPDRRGVAREVAATLGGASGVTAEQVATDWRTRPWSQQTTPVTQTPESPPLSTRVPPRRVRMRATATMGFAIVAVALLTGAFVVWDRPSAQTATAESNGNPAPSAPAPTQSQRPLATALAEAGANEQAAAPSSPAAPTPSSATPETSAPPRSTNSDRARFPYPGYGGDRRVGFGPVKLGMTRSQLEGTGETRGYSNATGGTCTRYNLRAGGYAIYSETQGRVVAIEFAGKMATSRGVRIGSPAYEVWAAYPEASGDRFGYLYPDVAPGVFYTINILDDIVELLVLQSERADCAL